jgi:hypothetical protein
MAVQAIDDAPAQSLSPVVPGDEDAREYQDRDTYHHAYHRLVHGRSLLRPCSADQNTSFTRRPLGFTRLQPFFAASAICAGAKKSPRLAG